MIDQLSPFTRRILALTLLGLLMLGAVNLLLLPVSGLIRSRLDHLADIRFERARLENVAARPSPAAGDAVPQDLYIHAASEKAAALQLSSLITQGAQTAGVTVEQVTEVLSDPPYSRLVATQLRVNGAELPMMRFLNAVESGKPLVRFVQWKLSAPQGPDGSMQLDATAAAAWQPVR